MKKLLELMQAIPTEQEFDKINGKLIELKLLPQTKYQLVNSENITTAQGIVWHQVTMSCELTLLDTETGEESTCIALGSGLDRVHAITDALKDAHRNTWLACLNIHEANDHAEPEPQIIVETPESRLISQITALWKWDPAQLTSWIDQRFKKPLEQLNVVELEVVRKELEDYGKQR